MIKRIGIVVLMVSAWMFAGSAMALTPGNLSLKNTAKLTYTGNPDGIFAAATVKVNVIAANPTLSAPSDVTKAEGQTITTEVEYTVTATNNGPDSYNFTNETLSSTFGLTDVANTDFNDVSYIYKDSGGGTLNNSGNPLTLGVSAFSADFGINATSITVPSDGTADDSVNGLVEDDIVIINSVAYSIQGNGVGDVVVDDGTSDVTLILTRVVGGGVGGTCQPHIDSHFKDNIDFT